jgi:HPt (histidine-containing phosphotransfer) domain-containing protein
MARRKIEKPQVETFKDHEVITPDNPLRFFVRRVAEDDKDDPVARAEEALAQMSGHFTDWMIDECARVSAAGQRVAAEGFTEAARDEIFRAAHDIKGDAATFGYPAAAAAAESLCRIIEHAPDLKAVPIELIDHHVNAVQAIVRERATIEVSGVAGELSRRLKNVADEYLTHVNRDRPEHLDAILSPSIAPGD